jgi:type IV secretion system protein VirD4
MAPIHAVRYGVGFLRKGYIYQSKTGARFAKRSEYRDFLSPGHTGLLLDGHRLHLSERESFQNVCVIARVGAGKTSRFIIPNILDKAQSACSLVINDPKGEAFEATSGTLARNGYRIILIDPENPERSHRFNPLTEARDLIELEQIAEILVAAGNPGDRDPFWNRGATRFIGLLLKCLRNVSIDNPDHLTLANLNYLFQNFGGDGAPLDDWMSGASIDPENPTDATLWNEWKGALTGNEEGVRSFVLNALTALRAMSNRSLARLTSKSDFDLASLRHQKTAIYLVTPPQYQEYYAFLVSIFFRSVFNAAMRSLPGPRDLPIYVLYDEFGHSTIPDFVSTANTLRAYRVSLSIVLQSIAQLNARYGLETARAIQGGFNTYLTFAGSDPETALFFERVIGKVRERQRRDVEDLVDTYREYNLLNANEVRTLKSHQALIVSTNRNPVLIPSTPYFEERGFSRMVRTAPFAPVVATTLEPLDFVRL